jgi:glutaconate CoA-transferase subunit B
MAAIRQPTLPPVQAHQPGQFTIDEQICVCISRRIQNGDVVALGLATPLPAVAALLAQRTHAPAIYLASAIGQCFCRSGPRLGLQRAEGEWLAHSMGSHGFVQAASDFLPAARPLEFFRPGQVDRHGNFNNLAIGRDYRRPRLRMPGSGGIPDVTVVFDRVQLYVPRHSRVTFVAQLDFVSGLGHSPARRHGRGPEYLVSDLGQFDFAGGELRLTHLHPGASLEKVRSKTGFEFAVASPLQESEPPTELELTLLREAVDPLGLRRLELLGGNLRRAVLREIIQAENAA